MKVIVKRIRQGKNSTLSEIHVNGKFFCYGLEDSVREFKIKGSTAIPAGKYKLGLRIYGGMHAKYKRSYPEMHRGMIEIQAIPNFSYVYIHKGNNFSHTEGCLLVGEAFEFIDKDYELQQSAKAYKRLYKELVEAVASGEGVIAIN